MTDEFKEMLNQLNWTEDEFDKIAGEDIRLTLVTAFVTINKLTMALEAMDVKQQAIDDINLRLDLMGASHDKH